MEREKPIRLLIADNHSEVRRRLVKRLSLDPNMEVVGEVNNLSDLCQKIEELKPDAVLLDPVEGGRNNSLEILRNLFEGCHDVPIVVLTALADTSTTLDYMKLGVQKTIAKGIDSHALVHEIREVVFRT